MFKFNVPGDIKAKARARAGKHGFYTPAETVNYENWIRVCFMEKYRGQEPLGKGVPLCMYIRAMFKIPASTSNKKREQMLKQLILPTKKPDVDNIFKIVSDALNGIVYYDDAQIVSGKVEKIYARESGLFVSIYQYPDYSEE